MDVFIGHIHVIHKVDLWYDWGYFQWTGINKPIASQMMMIFDLSDCELNYDPDIDPDLVHTVNYLVRLPHLTK